MHFVIFGGAIQVAPRPRNSRLDEFLNNAEMTREILLFHPALELKSREYAGTGLGWALYGSGDGWHRHTEDFVATVRALMEAGATLPPHAEELEPSEAVLEMLP